MRPPLFLNYTTAFLLSLFLLSCNNQRSTDTLFVAVSPEHSGVSFVNQIDENDTLNVIDYTYIYNGGGLGVGDVNNDGLKDLFFAGNLVENRLYLNKGDLQFEDISQSSGIDSTNRWCTGVSMIDINQDGLLDIYVSVANKFNREASRNLLYINQGNDDDGKPSFIEMAAAYGLDDDGYSTHAAFFDYDRDGDLDMYLLTNGIEQFNHNNVRPKKISGEGISTDKLYRNDGVGSNGHPQFTDVSRSANILKEGYGLGIAISDFNQDGWPDVYAANDFITNDLMWINNGDGTFTDKAPDYIKHQSYNGMGTDVADFNNDGLVDIVVLDMLPEDNQRQKTTLGKMNYEKFQLMLEYDYTPQYVRNTLQLNNGLTPEGELSFSEVGQLAGIYKTDWSWSSLFADYDNDGQRDLLITNGYLRDVTDLDYINYQSAGSQFGSVENSDAKTKKFADELPSVKIHNYMYRNQGDLTFEDVSAKWGISDPSFSNGTVFADLDNDGDLDLVMNNINDPAFIYENKAEKLGQHYLKFRLKGAEKNRAGLGASLSIWYEGKQQYHYHNPYRGYKATQDEDIHFGLGSAASIDSLLIVWPDGKRQRLGRTAADQLLELSYSEARDMPKTSPQTQEPLLLSSPFPDYLHQDNEFVDFRFQPLMPRMYSMDGPGLAVADINGDQRDDFMVGGAKGFESSIFIQQADGQFSQQTLSEGKQSEDAAMLFFDADGDGDQDLYVGSGGNEFYEGHEAYLDRLYINDGAGNFSLRAEAIPEIKGSTSCVVAADYDADGDLDLFVGGRLRPHNYPMPPRSYLLRNDGGRFTDVTAELAPGLENIGLVTSALWSDYNGDGRPDLVIAGEWMPITFFRNEGDSFSDVTAESGLSAESGWWNSLIAADFDKDGDMDYVAGNLGLNSKFHASAQEPVSLYAKDFDNNQTVDPIISYYVMGEEFPLATRDDLIGQLVEMRRRFPRYLMYGQASFSDIFSEKDLEGAYVLKARNMASSYIENLGNGKFSMQALPQKAQFAPAFGMLAEDVNQDGHLDLMMVGNSYASEAHQGRYDAGIGNLLLGNGQGGFVAAPVQQSGFFVNTDAKALVRFFDEEQQPHYLVSSNADSLKLFSYSQPMSERMLILSLKNDDFYARIELRSGESYREEFYYGNAHFAQSARKLCVSKADLSKVSIVNFRGESRQVYPEAFGLTQK
ncbi:MAG: VCBS repeat-containing protein [Cyclobacteriaceae bacterium]